MSTLKSVARFVDRIFLNIPDAFVIAARPSFYPEKPRKSYLRRVLDIVRWCLRYRRSNVYYNIYGSDLKGADPFIYLAEPVFWKDLAAINHFGAPDSQACLLRDKYLFFRWMRANDLPVPDVFAIYKDGQLYNTEFDPIDLSTLENEKGYFVKETYGQNGTSVRRVADYDEFCALLPKLTGNYILQRAVIQHDELNRLSNSGAANTMRIVTVKQGDTVYPLFSLLRTSTSKSGSVDNMKSGGLGIGVNKDGTLKQWALYQPKHGTKTDVHPDSGVRFSEFKIPLYQEALDAACKAHKCFYNIPTIGWDIAVTQDGPCFIEGNENWGLWLVQACDRPIRAEWKKIIADLK